MAFKERVKRFGNKVKRFWNEHWEDVVLVGEGVAIVGTIGACCYGLHKYEQNKTNKLLLQAMDEAEKETEEYQNMIEEKTAWNKDWDEMAVQFEVLTHQPLGSCKNGFTEEEGYVDPLNGNCFIIAGYNSYYNESPDQLDYYVLDNEGWYHRMPDELRT